MNIWITYSAILNFITRSAAIELVGLALIVC